MIVDAADLTKLPPNLPVPIDDGACDHLVGLELPDIELPAVDATVRSLRSARSAWLVLYVYSRTGGPGIELPGNWDLIPGARGCTPQACAFRDHAAELEHLDASVWGVSAQPIEEQRDFVARMGIPFPLLNDGELRLARPPLRLPTFTVAGMTLYRRVTIIARRQVITHVVYPVFPPDENAAEVVTYLESQGG